MKAMILAAGLGTRLRPLTAERPKALVELNGKPLLQILIERLKDFGIREIIVNVHHFGRQIIDFVRRNESFGLHIEFSVEDTLLDTGGGLKKAARFFDDGQPFLLHNVDVLTDLDYLHMLRYHNEKQALATLAVRRRKTSRYFLFNDSGQLCGWRNTADGREVRTCSSGGVLEEFSFMGIHIISPEIFSLLTEEGSFSIVQSYLRLSSAQKIFAFPAGNYRWLDVGKKENLDQAARLFPEMKAH